MKKQRYKKSNIRYKKSSNRLKASIVLSAFISSIGIVGCQPAQDTDNLTQETQVFLQPSANALADIDKFQEVYVTRMLELQQNQAAEFAALQAADNDVETDVKPNAATALDTSNADTSIPKHNAPSNSTLDNNAADNGDIDNGSDAEKVDTEKVDGETVVDTLELTLSNLPLATTPIAPPETLTAEEHRIRYQEAMQALYLAEGESISAQRIDTLLNIATVIPDIFSNDDLARRLVLKSPALARLLKQYQIWEQIEAQQSAELEALNQAQIEEQEKQAEEFEALIKEFDATIKGYDEQIAKYEKMLEEFE